MQNTQFKKWNTSEEIDLLDEFKQGLDLQSIARKHDRSIRAIQLRLLDIASRLHEKGVSEESIFRQTGYTLDDIKKRNEEKNNDYQLKNAEHSLNAMTHNLMIEKKLDEILGLLRKT